LNDIALPISAIADFVQQADAALHAAQPAVRIINFGHLGEGNLHYNVRLPLDTPPQALADATAQFQPHRPRPGGRRPGLDRRRARRGPTAPRRDAPLQVASRKSQVEFDLMMRISSRWIRTRS